MASSSEKLTRFSNAQTLVTSDFMNSIFGGLSGTTEGDSLAADDPRVIGHVHDGENLDGHAGKIDLVSHVTNQLRNTNLGDQAVTARTVARFEDPSQAIPVSEVIDSTTFYYIDINTIPTGGAFDTASNVTSNTPGDLATDDFVFGSDSLDDDADADHYNRFLFDKSKASFRAGRAESTQWDDANRGTASVAFGKDSTAAADFSTVAGGDTNSINAASPYAFIAGGLGGSITGSTNGFIGAGTGNSLLNAAGSTIVNGALNAIGPIAATAASILGGTGNTIASSGADTRSTIAGGRDNAIGGVGPTNNSFIGAGDSNLILEGDNNAIISGNTNSISAIGGIGQNFIGTGFGNSIPGGSRNAIVTGISNAINSTSVESGILSGNGNIVDPSQSAIGSGSTNRIFAGATESFIGSGNDNRIVTNSLRSFIGSGISNRIFGDNPLSVIGGGLGNEIQDGSESFIGGGNDNLIGQNLSSADSVIVGGLDNELDGPYSFIGGGRENIINTVTVNGINTIVGGGGNGDGNIILIENGEGFGNFIGGGSDNQITVPLAISRNANHDVITGGDGNIIRVDLGTPGVHISASNAQFSNIVGGQNNLIEAASGSSILGGSLNLVGQEALSPDLGSGTGMSAATIVGGTANRVSFQGFYGVASGLYSLSNSWGMVAQSSGNFSGGGAENAGEAGAGRVTFVGEVGPLESTNYYIYLNSVGVTTSASNAGGYGLAVQPEGSMVVRYWAVGRANSGGTPQTYAVEGEAVFQRNGFASVGTVAASTSTALSPLASGWLGAGGGSIDIVPSGRGIAYDLIFRLNTGSSGTRPFNTRWTIMVEATWVTLDTP
jgi:hypothetical protein